MKRWVSWASVGGMTVLIIGFLFGLVAFIRNSSLTNELSLPVLAISGIVALLGALAVVAVSFTLVNMSDRTQALGLPTGSVRAVIALSLVVLFAILSVYLFSNLQAATRLEQQTCLTSPERDMFMNTIPREQMPLARQMPDKEAANCPPVTGSADANQSKARYTIQYQATQNPAGADFAKQLLVLIGTLVTSVASFYFGAQAVSQAQAATVGINVVPSLLGVDPRSITAGTELTLAILGDNLNSVNKAQISLAGDTITATHVTSNSGRVQAMIQVPSDAKPGMWDVSIVDTQGRIARLPAALKVLPSEAQEDAGDGSKKGTKVVPNQQQAAPQDHGPAPPTLVGPPAAPPAQL